MRDKIIRCLLDRSFYEQHLGRINDKLLADKEPQALYKVIHNFYSKNDGSIGTVSNLRDLFEVASRGRISESTSASYHMFLDGVEKLEVSPEVAGSLVKELHEAFMFEEATNILATATDHKAASRQVMQMLQEIDEGNVLKDADTIEFVAPDLKKLLDKKHGNYRWRFVHPGLNEKIRGIGDGMLIIIGARPNIGKTHFAVANIFQPDGFADQGANILYVGNEEPAYRTLLRGMCSYTGYSEDEFNANPDLIDKAQEKFSKIAARVKIWDNVAGSLTEIEDIVKKIKPDIVVCDMLDKVRVDGKFNSTEEGIRYLYTHTRELAKRYDLAVIGMSQASADAEGKKVVGYDVLEHSKTGKAAEADLIIMLGKENTEIDSGIRFANIAKNKICGIHEHVVYKLNQGLSRITV